MLIVYGTYRLAPRLVAYRNDWCNHCDKPVLRSSGVRSTWGTSSGFRAYLSVSIRPGVVRLVRRTLEIDFAPRWA